MVWRWIKYFCSWICAYNFGALHSPVNTLIMHYSLACSTSSSPSCCIVRHKVYRKFGPLGMLLLLQCRTSGMLWSQIACRCMNCMNVRSSDILFVGGQCQNMHVLEGIIFWDYFVFWNCIWACFMGTYFMFIVEHFLILYQLSKVFLLGQCAWNTCIVLCKTHHYRHTSDIFVVCTFTGTLWKTAMVRYLLAVLPDST